MHNSPKNVKRGPSRPVSVSKIAVFWPFLGLEGHLLSLGDLIYVLGSIGIDFGSFVDTFVF